MGPGDDTGVEGVQGSGVVVDQECGVLDEAVGCAFGDAQQARDFRGGRGVREIRAGIRRSRIPALQDAVREERPQFLGRLRQFGINACLLRVQGRDLSGNPLQFRQLRRRGPHTSIITPTTDTTDQAGNC